MLLKGSAFLQRVLHVRALVRRWRLSLVSRAFRSNENMASDSDSEEDFVTYGTPLEPLEEGKVVFLIFKH